MRREQARMNRDRGGGGGGGLCHFAPTFLNLPCNPTNRFAYSCLKEMINCNSRGNHCEVSVIQPKLLKSSGSLLLKRSVGGSFTGSAARFVASGEISDARFLSHGESAEAPFAIGHANFNDRVRLTCVGRECCDSNSPVCLPGKARLPNLAQSPRQPKSRKIVRSIMKRPTSSH